MKKHQIILFIILCIWFPTMVIGQHIEVIPKLGENFKYSFADQYGIITCQASINENAKTDLLAHFSEIEQIIPYQQYHHEVYYKVYWRNKMNTAQILDLCKRFESYNANMF